MGRKRKEPRMYKRKGSPNFVLEYYDPSGKRIRSSSGTASASSARKELNRRISARDRPVPDARKSREIKVAGPWERRNSRSRDLWLAHLRRIYPTFELQPLVSAEELAKHLHVSEQIIVNYANHLLVPGYYVGGEWRFDILEVRTALRAIGFK